MMQNNMRKIAIFISISLVFLLAYKITVQYLLHDWMQWQHGAYAHGFVVLAVSAYMIWGRKDELKQIEYRPNTLGIFLVFCVSLLWVSSIYLGVRFVESLSFFLMIPLIVYVIAGWPFLKVILFPLCYLLVAFPVWEILLPYLQSVAASLSHLLLKLSGITILREDAYLIVPAGKFLVAEGCSGLRYLLAAMTFGGFYIYLEGLKSWRAISYLSIVIFAAILANALRIAAVVIAGNMTEMQHPWVDDHLMLGWYIFAAMLLPLFYIGNKFGDAELKYDDVVTNHKSKYKNNNLVSFAVVIPLLIAALCSGPLVKEFAFSKTTDLISYDENQFAPDGKGGWEKQINESLRHNELLPIYKGADAKTDQIYVNNGNEIRLFFVTYQYQEQGKELISVDNYLFSEEKWQPILREVLNDENTNIEFVEVLLRNSLGSEKLIHYWYRTAGQLTVRPVVTKLYDLYGLFTGQNLSSVIMFSVDNINGLENSRKMLSDFHEKMIEEINQSIDEIKN